MAQLQLGDALKEFLNRSKLKAGLRAVQIEGIWEDVMGKTIARYTDKIQIINNTLFVYTSVAALKQELVYQKTKIIERINEALHEKAITDIVIK
ncbi:DUF721 domain-containing protein [Parafilimonas sp.]|uniref:DUF721 domain-containing protein n=1 Tax=Parafilimonas sp. TaxID=1969739 RepID=UPI0039E516AC